MQQSMMPVQQLVYHANRATIRRVSQTSLESVSQTSLDPFVVGLREFDDDSGVIRAVQCFFMEENDPRETSEEVTLSVSAVRATADADDGYLRSEEHWFPVVLGCGADATVLPSEMLTGVGQPSQENPHHLHDAQGTKIEVKGLRDVCFIMETEEGRKVQVHERAHFADEVRVVRKIVRGWMGDRWPGEDSLLWVAGQDCLGDATQKPDCCAGEDSQSGSITMFCESPRRSGSEAWKRA